MNVAFLIGDSNQHSGGEPALMAPMLPEKSSNPSSSQVTMSGKFSTTALNGALFLGTGHTLDNASRREKH
jgi:hypothetical protein